MTAPLSDSRFCIRPMRSADVSSALELTVQAGWNQTAADWLRMLSLEPGGCFVAELNGSVVGTTVCCAFGPVAWLALVLVEQTLRRQGIGRRLVETGLRFADDAGAQTVRLDATPLGRPVYERLGFEPQFELARWGGVPGNPAEAAQINWGATNRLVVTAFMRSAEPRTSTSPRLATRDTFNESRMDELLALDRRATRTDRAKLLERLFVESPPLVASDAAGRVAGFLGQRAGRLATQIGPCGASPMAAEQLLLQAFDASRGRRIIVDLPLGRPQLNELASKAGLTVERTLLRMCRGATVVEDADWFQISSGAELG